MYIFEVKAVRYKCLRNMGKNTHVAIAKLQKKQQKTKGKIQKMTSNMRNLLLLVIMWSWRESNPRPNGEAVCFLHAYSSLRFSRVTKTWTTK